MMHHIPSGMEEPSDTYQAIGTETLVRTVRHDRSENEFPHAESAIEVCRACPSNHNGHELLAVRLFQQRRRRYEENGYQYRPDASRDMKIRKRMCAHGFCPSV
jgi:hypothetical protein